MVYPHVMTTETLTEFIKAHAVKHYEDGGWDVIVECWEDATIAEVLTEAGATTEADALVAFQFVEVYADRQADARNSAF